MAALAARAARGCGWLWTNLRPQKQSEYSQVAVSLELGDITSGQMRAIAALSKAYADGLVRTTVDQNLLLRWVRSGQVPGLYRRLAAAGLAPGGAAAAGCRACTAGSPPRVSRARGRARSPTSSAVPAPSLAALRSRSRAAW